MGDQVDSGYDFDNTLCCNLINQNQNHMTISSLLKGGIQIGLKNFLSLVGALILYFNHLGSLLKRWDYHCYGFILQP